MLDCLTDDEETVDYGMIGFVILEERLAVQTCRELCHLFGGRFDVGKVGLPITRH